MNFLHVDRLWEFFKGIDLVLGVLWGGLFFFAIGVLILIYTRWGQSHPLEKCMGLSVLAHLLLLVFSTTACIVSPSPSGAEAVFHVDLWGGDAKDEANTAPVAAPSAKISVSPEEKPWETLAPGAVAQSDLPQPSRVVPLPESPPRTVKADNALLKAEPVISLASTQIAPEPKLETSGPPIGASQLGEDAQPIEVPQTQRREVSDPLMSATAAPRSPIQDDTSPWTMKSSGDGASSALWRPTAPLQRSDASAAIAPAVALPEASFPNARINSPGTAPMPEAYKLRTMPNRFNVAQHHGATTQTEKAVKAALKWLAENQAPDGRWDAGGHGAGVEQKVLGQDHQNAGSRADSAVTGLALLALLASGNTHQGGDYRENVRRGLEYLIRIQGPDGNLGGKAAIYEMMYSHSMAACALSEAYGMTKDPGLREPVRRAIDYIVKTQDPKGGGWRYLPNIPGDTSQLGWQVMALKSAELAGILMPDATRQGIIRFLQSVSGGKNGGLASYRPGEQVTRTMSAEALVCWQFLGLPREHPACNEAGNYLLGELPGPDVKPNDYYWYYATLAMYQLQGEYWRRWNEAMHKAIVERQVVDGPQAGSWNTDTLWGGYGGRVYTTAIAALTLEVYYRYLPLYAEAVIADRRSR
jgi:hypothetical protein